MQIKVKHRVDDYIVSEGEFKRVEANEELTFATWDDFQNWQGYTVEALDGKPLKVEVSTVKEA